MDEGPEETRDALVVAATCWRGDALPLVRELAERLGLDAYETRMRVVRAPPSVLQITRDAEEARALLGWIRGRGHGAVGCRLGSVRGSAAMAQPRGFELGAEALVGHDREGILASIAYRDVLALVVAMHVRTEETQTQTVERRLSLSRAALTGGLSFQKKVRVERRERAEDRERVIYVFPRSSAPPMLLREHGLRYDGLGAACAPTTAENFHRLCAELRGRAPGALYDERLVRGRSASTDLCLSGTTADSTVATGNASATDLAAHLLALAHHKGEL